MVGLGKGRGWGFDAIDDLANQKAREKAGLDPLSGAAGGDMEHRNNPQVDARIASNEQAVKAQKDLADASTAAATA